MEIQNFSLTRALHKDIETPIFIASDFEISKTFTQDNLSSILKAKSLIFKVELEEKKINLIDLDNDGLEAELFLSDNPEIEIYIRELNETSPTLLFARTIDSVAFEDMNPALNYYFIPD